jgi:hypothetical protein
MATRDSLPLNAHLMPEAVPGLSNTAFQIGAALGVAIASTVAVSRTVDYLAANADADPVAGLTEGFQSASLACTVLALIGAAVSVLLLGRPRATAEDEDQLEAAPGRGGLRAAAPRAEADARTRTGDPFITRSAQRLPLTTADWSLADGQAIFSDVS